MKNVAKISVIAFPCFFLLMVLYMYVYNRDFSLSTLLERMSKYSFPNPYDGIKKAGDSINVLTQTTFMNFSNPWTEVSWWNLIDVVKAVGSTVSQILNVMTYFVKVVFYGFYGAANFVGSLLTDFIAFVAVIFGWL